MPVGLALARPDMIFTVSAIQREGMHATLHLGDLKDLLSRASDVPVTISQR
jgi:hypothetical protein